LANTCTAEETDLATLSVRSEQVDHFDARFEDLDVSALVDELWRGAVDRQVVIGDHGARVVDGTTAHVQNAAEGSGTDGHLDSRARVFNLSAADESLCRVHRDGTND